MTHDPASDPEYQGMLGRTSVVYLTGQIRAAQAVNAQIIETCWQIDRYIQTSISRLFFHVFGRNSKCTPKAVLSP